MTDPILQIQQAIDASPFIRTCGLKLVKYDPDAGTLSMRMPFIEALGRMPDSTQFHGGAIAVLIDTVGTLALAAKLQAPVPTIDFRVDFLHPAMDTDLLASAVIRRQGKLVSVIDVEVENDQQQLIALGRGIFGGGKR